MKKPVILLGALTAAGGLVAGSQMTTNTVVEGTRTLFYQVSAINANGEGPRSNEVSVVFSTLPDFQKYIKDIQAAAYYSKWTVANPGELSRWTQYRDQALQGHRVTQPVMNSKFGAALVDAALLYLDTVS